MGRNHAPIMLQFVAMIVKEPSHVKVSLALPLIRHLYYLIFYTDLSSYMKYIHDWIYYLGLSGFATTGDETSCKDKMDKKICNPGADCNIFPVYNNCQKTCNLC